MRKSILWFVLLTLFEIPYVLAQNGFRVTGQIISADDNQPVIGVSIIEKGTTNGVITDVDGNYSIMDKITCEFTVFLYWYENCRKRVYGCHPL